jgi:acyl carrier protein
MNSFLSELEASLLGCPKGSLKGETRFREEPWWDSLALLVVLASFQNVYGSQITPAQLAKCQTIREIAELAQ